MIKPNHLVPLAVQAEECQHNAKESHAVPASQQETQRLAVTATQPDTGSQVATPSEPHTASVQAAAAADDPCNASRTQSEAQHVAEQQHAVQELAQEPISVSSLTQDSKQQLLQHYRAAEQKWRHQTNIIKPLADLPQCQNGQIVRPEVCHTLVNLY